MIQDNPNTSDWENYLEWTVRSFTENQRVELSPSTDAWMMGDRFGTVEKVGRKLLHVRMDRSGRLLRILPRNIYRGES